MKILLIEDDQNLSRFITKGLRQAGFAVEIATDGCTGLHMALALEIDLAIVDIMLPLLDGYTLIQKLRKKRSQLPVLVLSAKRSVDDKVRGLELGSDDYLTKPFSFSELLARIRALLRRSSNQGDSTQLQFADIALDLLTRKVVRSGQELELLPKEFILLEYLLRNRGRVLTRTQILEHVWDFQFDPDSNVVDVHICKLREKLGDKAKKFIRTIRGVGYVLEKEKNVD